MTKKNPFQLSDGEIAASLLPFCVRLSTDQMAKIREYIRLLLKWNQSLNLTSIVEPAEILAHHFGESMFINSVLPVENGRLADLGAGAGFPGLALKIVSPELQIALVESNKKKCAFLSEVVRTLELTDVEVIPLRFNEIRVEPGYANFVTARALGGFSELLHWAKTALTPRGHVILWLGGEDAAKVSATPGWVWQPAIRIPESQRRFILIGRQNPA